MVNKDTSTTTEVQPERFSKTKKFVKKHAKKIVFAAGAIIAGRGAEDDSVVAGGLDCEFFGRTRAHSSIRAVDRDHIDSAILHHDCILKPLDERRARKGIPVQRHLQHHDFGLTGDARHTDAIVPDGGNRARDVGAVSVIVGRVGVAVPGVDADDVVDVAVALVVDPVAGDLEGVAPEIGD